MHIMRVAIPCSMRDLLMVFGITERARRTAVVLDAAAFVVCEVLAKAHFGCREM